MSLAMAQEGRYRSSYAIRVESDDLRDKGDMTDKQLRLERLNLGSVRVVAGTSWSTMLTLAQDW